MSDLQQFRTEPCHALPISGDARAWHALAIVTGGGSGIGRAASVLFAREGADVAITYLPVEQPDAEVTAE